MEKPLSHSRSQNSLFGDYTAQLAERAGHNDEMLATDGSIKPVWSAFAQHLSGLTLEDLGKRFARGDQYLRDAGVLYRHYDESRSTEREWPLSHIPVLLDEAEWQTISAGLIERAELLEFIVRDFYGANDLVASGQVPATLLSQNPAWLRPMVGMHPKNENFLNFLSFEIGRGPDGKWWVISDLIEAPSTAGFAVENRMATSRVFPNYFQQANVHRLASFFKQFQKNLFDIKGRANDEIALLSPGPMNQNYAEHAYIARYLGLMLVEGEDLMVQDGKAMVRTVAGPKPLSLLWNRLPSMMSDPMELDASSVLGTPGLLQALRGGSLKTLNAVGAGVLETRALMAFFPKIAREKLGHGLTMPNIATWWCGQDNQRDHVIANQQRMMVGSAFSTTPLMADPATTVFADEDNSARVQRLTEMLQKSGRGLVGQEAVTLSTTPAFENGKIVPRPMCVRIFMSRTRNGWQLMPGGYARISASDDAKALAMQQGGKVADVWVIGNQPVPKTSLIPPEIDAVTPHSISVNLPSRAADNLFWLGRNVERAEQNMRLFRAYFGRMSSAGQPEDSILKFLRTHLMGDVKRNAADMAQGFATPLSFAMQTASRISDRFSSDGMMALRTLVEQTNTLDSQKVPFEEIIPEISALLRQVAGFAGLVHENMYRSDGWRFLSLGISVERASNLSALLSICTSPRAPEGALDLALEVGDSVGAHRARFSIGATRVSVVDLLGLDRHNPRSVRYHVSRAKNHIEDLQGAAKGHILSDAMRHTLMLETRLAASRPTNWTPEDFNDIKQKIWDISDTLHENYLV